MKLKEGVCIKNLKLVMRPTLQAADAIWKENGQELVITSGLEGTHSASSLHYYGFALDFRTRYFEQETQLKVYQQLKNALQKYGKMYRIILEESHIHVEFIHIPEITGYKSKWNT